ncbi:anhydro-N-acetylmuramic acid kinase [soil metagenome]
MHTKTENSANVIGLMSGTSLDGLDICYVRFSESREGWKYDIAHAETISYSEEWISRLLMAEKASGEELLFLHTQYGKFLGECVTDFIALHKCAKPDLVASHGHTIFHQPEKGFTFQLGSGAALFASCGIPIVCDFRSLDVALGGQGAPLVPIGDRYLFAEYSACINLGGFANISFEENEKRIAYDICAVNYVMNYLSKRAGKEFDENGKLAADGKIIQPLLDKLNGLTYFEKSPPKSIGREWVEETIFPLLPTSEKTEDLLRTFTEHIAVQLSKSISGKGKVLVTGGGAFNNFLIELLKVKSQNEIIIPDALTINFKEALIFAFLGLLRSKNRINTLKSVTGASCDSSGGILFQ